MFFRVGRNWESRRWALAVTPPAAPPIRSSPLGRSVASAARAQALARDGHDLVLTARRVEPMAALAQELAGHGAAATILAADLQARRRRRPGE
jgi:hypothetical protein